MLMLDPSVYALSSLAGLLIILLIILASLFELKGAARIIVTAFSTTLIAVHYFVIYVMSRYEEILIYPFILLEISGRGGSISVDLGQVLLLLLIVLWRRELKGLLRFTQFKARGIPCSSSSIE